MSAMEEDTQTAKDYYFDSYAHFGMCFCFCYPFALGKKGLTNAQESDRVTPLFGLSLGKGHGSIPFLRRQLTVFFFIFLCSELVSL